MDAIQERVQLIQKSGIRPSDESDLRKFLPRLVFGGPTLGQTEGVMALGESGRRLKFYGVCIGWTAFGVMRATKNWKSKERKGIDP